MNPAEVWRGNGTRFLRFGIDLKERQLVMGGRRIPWETIKEDSTLMAMINIRVNLAEVLGESLYSKAETRRRLERMQTILVEVVKSSSYRL